MNKSAAQATASQRRARLPQAATARSAAAPVTLLPKASLRLLAALAEPGGEARPDPTRDGMLIVRAVRAGMSLGQGAHKVAAADPLLAADLVRAVAPGGRIEITEPGRAFLRRRAGGDDPYRAQQAELVVAAGPDGREPVLVNAAESPLAWLRRRRDGAGTPLIDAAEFEAGERLRRDLTQAGMLPGVTARWDGAIGSGGGARDVAGATDMVIAARQRVRRALDAVGGDFAGLLVDLCGFLKGLELIERERRWPPRSGKVVLRLALARLAEFYGLARAATGPAASRGIRAWQEPDTVG